MHQTIPEAGSISFEERTSKRVPYDWGFGSTPRTAALRAALKWKAAVVKDFEEVFLGLAKCEFRNGESIRVDVDRARLITESFRQTDGQPWALRQARAFAHLCDKLPIFIKAGELIVGDPNGAHRQAAVAPRNFVRLHGRRGNDGEFLGDGDRRRAGGDRLGDLRVLARPKCGRPHPGGPAPGPVR